MATSKNAKWTIVVVMEENENFNKTYQVSPDSRLSELMRMWKEDFELFEDYVFVSADEEIRYCDDSLTLKTIGETAPRSRMVNLRAELICKPTQEPTSEIFVRLQDKCHHLLVKPHDKLYEVLWRIPGKPKYLEYDGLPLNVMHTVEQAQLKNKSVIHEPKCSVTVKLSSGYTIIIQMSADSVVSQLKENVNVYETTDFSLTYQGRYLKSDESVRKLTQVVEVTTAKFAVNFKDHCVSWITKNEPISVSEFLCQLAANADINLEELETVYFVCVGCQRRICQSDNYIQQLPVECCKEKSLTLDMVSTFDSGTNLETNNGAMFIQSFQEYLIESILKQTRAATSRDVHREMKNNFAKESLNYNSITQCSKKIQKIISELEDEIQELRGDNEILKNKKVESKKEETEKLYTKNMENIEEKDALKEESMKLIDDNSITQINDPPGVAGVAQSHLPSKNMQELKVKLLVFYNSSAFNPISRPEVEYIGKYSWKSCPHMKCHIPGILPGWTSFDELQDILNRLFTGPRIKRIVQDRGYVAGNVAVRATFLHEDEAVMYNQSPYYDVEGEWHTWEEAGKPSGLNIDKGGHAFICGRGRRTVLQIYS